MSKRVHDGVIFKAGLICLSVGFLGAGLTYLENPDKHAEAIDAVHALIFAGLLICGFGYYLRTRRGQSRRLSDWIDTETQK
jgi:VIT1/CCC1 family predicted Fe2+/Mn2+ transporter